MRFALSRDMRKSCQASGVEQQKLQQWVAAHGTPQQVALRCRIVLAAAAGESDVAIANALAVNRNAAMLWRKRFGNEGLDGLWDYCSRTGTKAHVSDKVAAIVDLECPSSTAHRTEIFKLSRDPTFLQKMTVRRF
jgi:hypothetical protein